MASKRNLKKSINNLTFDLVSECYTYRHFHPAKDASKVNQVIEDLVETRNKLISKVSSAPTKGGKEISKYYKEFESEFKAMVSLLDTIEK